MKTSLQLLNEHLDQLVLWFRQNPEVTIQPEQKKRISFLVDRLNQLKVREAKIGSQANNSATIECQYCKSKIKSAKHQRHELHCKIQRSRLVQQRIKHKEIVNSTTGQSAPKPVPMTEEKSEKDASVRKIVDVDERFKMLIVKEQSYIVCRSCNLKIVGDIEAHSCTNRSTRK